MALTVTARGTGSHNASATTFTLSPASNLAVGSLAVLVVSADNAHTNGTAFTTFAVSDDKGNVWTRRASPLYDPGAANAGVEGAQFTTDMAGGVLTTSSVITVTFDTATTAKAWAMWEVVPAALKVVSYVTSGVNAGAATTTPTVTTASITSGDVVIGALHNEYGTAQTVTADADASSGAWSAQQTAEIGTTAAGMTVASQAKVTSGTATQTYNPTLGTSSNVILSWIQLREIPFLKVGALDQTLFALLGSMTLRFNTFEFMLKNPATIPARGDIVTLGLPSWTGTVTSVKTTDLLVNYNLVTVVATNTDVAAASAGPFGLSDAPNGTTTYAFREMSVTVSTNLDATATTTGVCTIVHAGLWPAMTFPLTSANRGYAAQSFSVRNTTVTWPKLTNPSFRIEFGDPIVTMQVWAAAQAAYAPDGSISGTKITDLSVTTPKLAANSVTAAKIAAHTITSQELLIGNSGDLRMTNPDFESGDLTGWSVENVGAGSISVALNNGDASNGQGLYRCHLLRSATDLRIAQVLPSATAGEYHAVQLLLGSNTFHSQGQVFVRYYDSSLALISTSATGSTGATLVTAMARFTFTFGPAPAATAYIGVVIQNNSTTSTMKVDDVSIATGSNFYNALGTVAINNAGITVTNGAITVTNPGATVIIDGTSDMFRILSTGTLSVATVNGDRNIESSTTLSGLGALASTPVNISQVGPANTSSDVRWTTFMAEGVVDGDMFVSGTSGGSPTQKVIFAGHLGWSADVRVGLDGSSFAKVVLHSSNQSGANHTAYTRYYLLAQTAI